MAARILVAEDNDSFAQTLTAFLERQGYRTERCADGAATLTSILRRPPDLLLLDLKLPKLHGADLLKKLRASDQTRSLPVIVLTGAYRGEHHARAARALGISAYLEKPVAGTVLKRAMVEALGAAPPPNDLLLAEAVRADFTGKIRFHLAGRTAELSLIRGLPATLEGGLDQESFVHFLEHQGRLTSSEADQLLTKGPSVPSDLVSQGLLGITELLDWHRDYLRHELLTLLALPPLQTEMSSGPWPCAVLPLPLSLPDLLLQGYHRLPALQRARNLEKERGDFFMVPTDDFFRFANLLSPTADEARLLASIDGRRTLAELSEACGPCPALLSLLGALRMFRLSRTPTPGRPPSGFVLRCWNEEEEAGEPEERLETFSDLVEEGEGQEAPQPPGAAAAEADSRSELFTARKALEGKNYYEIFEMTPATFSIDVLKERYFAASRCYGPELLMQLGGAELGHAEAILAALSDAYATLSDVVKKERYDELLGSERIGLGREGDESFQAQVQYQSGKVFLEMEEWDNAEKALRDACRIDPDNGDYLAHLAWTLYRHPAYARSRASRDNARKMLNRALTLERRCAPGYAFKGWILLEEERDALAEAEFTKALKIDARQALARKGMRVLREKQEQQKKGLFKRMFRQ